MADVHAIHTARFDSPIGELMAASTDRGLAYLALPKASGRGFRAWLRRALPGTKVEEGFAPNRAAVKQVSEYLAGKREAFDLTLDLRGTPFQLEVYRGLLEIPYGERRTYGELAERIGHPGAARAVGAANGANPIALVVPCHRVVAAGGHLGGYGGGLRLKRRLLAMEARDELL